MSSKAISAAFTHFLQFRLQYSSLALLYYDFALTFPREVQFMWRQKFRVSTALYICCRYALIANVLYLLAIAQKLGSTCNFWYKIIGALSVLGRAAVIAAFCIRTHAVWGRNAWVLGYMGIVGLACVALDITHVPGTRCVGSSTLPIAPEMLSILMVIFESSAAFLTTTRCVLAFRAGGGFKNRRGGLMYVLFEQGIAYFCIISIFTTAAVILNYRAPPGFFQRLPNAFTLPLSCILTARFLLELREWEANSQGSSAKLSALNFGGSPSRVERRHSAQGSRGETSLAGSGILSLDLRDFGEDPVVGASSAAGCSRANGHERSSGHDAMDGVFVGSDSDIMEVEI